MRPSKYPEYRTARLQGMTPNAAAKVVGISNTAGYKHEAKLAGELPAAEYRETLGPLGRANFDRRGGVHRVVRSSRAKPGSRIQRNKAELVEIGIAPEPGVSARKAMRQEIDRLKAEVAALRFRPATPMAELSRVERGTLGEDFMYYQLRRRGFEVYRPLYPQQELDLIVVRGESTFRCEVKSTCATDLSVGTKSTKYRDGEYVRETYTEKSRIDFFFLVDLLHEHAFIVPASELLGKCGRSLNTGSSVWEYKDRYDLLGG